jgi:hypothetical protein
MAVSRISRNSTDVVRVVVGGGGGGRVRGVGGAAGRCLIIQTSSSGPLCVSRYAGPSATGFWQMSTGEGRPEIGSRLGTRIHLLGCDR